MRIDIERVRELLEAIAEINRAPLEEIEVYENGEKVDIPTVCLEDWKFTGLGNINFIEMEPWKDTEFLGFMKETRGGDPD